MKKHKTKKICLITSSRSDYGLLKELIKKIKKSKKLDCHLSVTGTHLSHLHGSTYKEILADKININSKIKILKSGHTDNDISKSFSNGVFKFSNLYKKIKPDLILVLGDKFEIMTSVIAATLNRLPIAHIHGGEITEGAIDDVIRHSITKMSHLHFASTKIYQKRIIQMGENPKFVFNVGSIGLEKINEFKFKNEEYFKKKYNIDLKRKTIMICFHPVTLEPKTEKHYIEQILKALIIFNEINFIFTSSNADHGFKNIIKKIKSFVRKNKNAYYIKSFGRDNYLSCLKHSKVILGNSSSGIIEAPSLKTFTINLGKRQKGRIQSKSVINCKINTFRIKNTVKKLLVKRASNKKKYFFNPYFKKDTSKLIVRQLEKINYQNLIQKRFFDIN